MTPFAARHKVLLAVVVFVIGCQPTISSPPSTIPSSAASPAAGGGLPPGCAPIDLRDPDGARVELTGEWEAENPLTAPEEQVLLQQVGDCVWGTVHGVYRPASEEERETFVVNLGGDVAPAFTVDLEVVMVYQDARFPFAPYSTMAMFIEWDSDGRIRLREDRDPNERAGYCAAQPQFDCPPPVIWYRADDGP